MSIIQTHWPTALIISSLTACQIIKIQPSPPSKPMSIQIYQKWELQRGDRVNNQTVVSALGDLAIDMAGKSVYAPMSGEAKLDRTGCVLFAGTELPAYLFRFCGINTPKLGTLRKGQPIGAANLLVFATFQKQQNGTWAFVEPSKAMVEQTLKRS
jgi:hypothetical protein